MYFSFFFLFNASSPTASTMATSAPNPDPRRGGPDPCLAITVPGPGSSPLMGRGLAPAQRMAQCGVQAQQAWRVGLTNVKVSPNGHVDH